MQWVDIGSNLTHQSFDPDRDAVLVRARAAGVTRQVVTGADLESSTAAAAFAAAHPRQLWSTAGVHPHHAESFDGAVGSGMLELLRQPHVVAVGECGLDYYRNLAPPAAQRAAFAAQLDIAVRSGKPVFLHQRDAHRDFVAILRDYHGLLSGGVAHCFTGDRAQLDDYLALGLSIGVTGWVCDERRGGALRDAVPNIPGERLLLETDAPYLLPRSLKPQPAARRNEPQFLPHIASAVAALRNETLEALSASTTRNAVHFFGLVEAIESDAAEVHRFVN